MRRGFLTPSMKVRVKKSSNTTYRLNSPVGFCDRLVDRFNNPKGKPQGFFCLRGISRLNLMILKRKIGKIIVLICATYFCEKKFDTSRSLRKTGSSWEKMSIPNLSVPLFFPYSRKRYNFFYSKLILYCTKVYKLTSVWMSTINLCAYILYVVN